ncbi:MAG: 6-phosphogluconolactonase [Bacteroidota bacterium]
MELKVYSNKQEVAKEFSSFLVYRIETNAKLTIALSGGSTPKVVFDYLADHYQKLDWHKVHLFWGDERCVPPDHEESNYKMTVDHLLNHVSIPEENIHRIKGEDDPEVEALRYGDELDNHLPEVNGLPQFDLVILGLGSDGHTASIFPHEIDLWTSEKNCVVAVHPDSRQRRVSLTGKVINHAKEVAFLVTGEDKQEKVTEILSGSEHSKKYPASLVNPKSGKLYWFLDRKAGSKY